MPKTRVKSGQLAARLQFSGNQGIVFPVGGTNNRPGSPLVGEVRYNTDLNVFEGYTGSAWGTIGPYPFATVDYFTGDGSSAAFTLSNTPTDPNYMIVTINGVTMRYGLDYDLDLPNRVRFINTDDSSDNPPLENAEITIRSFQPITSASIPAHSITANELSAIGGQGGQLLGVDSGQNLVYFDYPNLDPDTGGDVEGKLNNIQIKANTISVRELKVTDGQIGQVLATDGQGNLSFITVTGGSGSGGASSFFDLTGQIGLGQISNSFITQDKLSISGTATNGYVLATDGTNLQWTPLVTSNINSGTAGKLAYYPTTGTTIDDVTALTWNSVNTRLENTGTFYSTGQKNYMRFHWDTLADLQSEVSPTTWHGMIVHVHDTGKVYYAHAGQWVPVASESSLPNTFNTISIAGQSSVVADSTSDTLTFVAGTGITLTTNASTDTITITNSSTGGNAFGTVAVAGQTDVVAESSNDTLTFVAGSGISLTTNSINDAITITNTGSASNSFATIAVAGQTSVVADSSTDTLTVVAGSGMTITTDAANDTITLTNSRPIFSSVVTDNGTRTASTTADSLYVLGGTDIATSIVNGEVIVNYTGSQGISNAFSTVAVAGQSNVVSSGASTLNIVAGSNVTITTNPLTNSVQISASGAGGAGGVASGTANQLAYYATTGSTVSASGSNLTWNGTTNTLAVTNLSVSGSVGNITAGTIASGNITSSGTVSANAITSTGTGTPTFTSGSDIILAPTGAVSLSNKKIINLATPTSNADAATKLYVDTAVGAISVVTYGISAETAVSGANLRLTGSNASTDDVNIAPGTGITVTRTDSNTITIASTVSSGATTFDGLSDVTINAGSLSAGHILYYNGSQWVNFDQGGTPTRTIDRMWPAAQEFVVTNSGSTAYLLTGTSGNNPTIYAWNGHTYAFKLVGISSHPFLIQTAAGANYDTGLTHIALDGTVSTGSNAQGKTSGTLYWQIPNNINGAYRYICSIHPNMVGTITIKDMASQ